MAPETETRETKQPTDEDVEATLRDVRAFMDDPIALQERAAYLLRSSNATPATSNSATVETVSTTVSA